MLSIRQLVKVYPGPVSALAGVDLDLEQGMFGLLGPNGAGKTSLMKILAGLLEPTSGEVWLDGEEVTTDPRKVWNQLGYLPQDFGFYPHLTGRAMLLHLLRLKGVRVRGRLKRYADELLERVNLSFAADRKIKGYSGGMRQRLGIAQAIAGDPRLLIVDEPTAGLDPEERLRFYHLLAELSTDRIVLLSTHIVEDVSVLCPQFAVISRGRLLARSTPDLARGAVEGSIYEGLVEPAALVELEARHTVTHALPAGSRKRVRLHAPTGDVPQGFAPVRATLEDAYLVLVRGRDPQIARALAVAPLAGASA
jgi:ABC-type multidrug transport system ATPase subunit